MTAVSTQTARLVFLVRVVRREAQHLLQTDQRLFGQPLSAGLVRSLESDPALAERVEAFVSRLSRLQDTLGDKLLPTLLTFAGERSRTMLENLDRAEKLGWISSADSWLSLRKLRNQMVHEYIEDPVIFADALNLGHEAVGLLIQTSGTMTAEADRLMAM